MASVTTGVGIFETGQTIATWDRYARDVCFFVGHRYVREPCPRWYCKDVTSVPDFLVEFLLPLRLWVLPLQQQLKPQRKPEVFSGGFFEVKCGLNFSLFLSRKKTGYFIWYFWYIIRDITWMSYSVLVFFFTKMLKKTQVAIQNLVEQQTPASEELSGLNGGNYTGMAFCRGIGFEKRTIFLESLRVFHGFSTPKNMENPKKHKFAPRNKC